jgi:hypothetical protein
VDAPYEPPPAPDLELTPQMDPQAATVAVLDALDERLREPSF